MSENHLYAPPAFLLIAEELKKSTSPTDSRKRVRSMLTELRDQSEYYIKENIGYEKFESISFDVHLHGALDILSGVGCADFNCKISAADKIARSIGLFSDRIWMTDRISEKFLDFGRATNEKIELVIDEVAVMSRLEPLMKEGIVRFKMPFRSVCGSCFEYFEKKVEKSAQQVASDFYKEFKFIEKKDDSFVIDTGKCFEPSVLLVGRKNEENYPDLKSIAEHQIHREIKSAFWALSEAALNNGTIFSNSRLALAGIMSVENKKSDTRAIFSIEKEKELRIPWVDSLTAEQIVQLRQEASIALPLFREKMATALSQPNDSISSTLNEIREQAVSVEQELKLKRKNSMKYWNTTYGVLGLGLSAYGAVTGDVSAGVGGLLPIIQLLMDHKKDHTHSIEALTARPGYVLVKAKDILAHAS